MRARLALCTSGMVVELREVSLREKPASMLAASPKGSVPVLVLPDGRVIDESWDIMLWALGQHDPDGWLGKNNGHVASAIPLVMENDSSFKNNLDRYKYADRYPQHTPVYYREAAEAYLRQLENRLQLTHFLLGDTASIADATVFPFVRQFAAVDKQWFAQAPYPALQRWLEIFSGSEDFAAVMRTYPVWHPGDAAVIMPHKIPAIV